MKPRVSFLIIVLVLFAFSASALTAEDLAGTYVGKWTDDLATGMVNRYDAVVVWEADSQVSTYRYIEFLGIYYASGVTEVEEDGLFVIGEGEAVGQVDLHGKHLRVVVHWRRGDIVEFKGHLSDKLPDWFVPQDY